MTTAREKADGWCYDWTKADGSLTRKKAAGDLIEIIQQVFAELREKKKEGCTQVGSSSPSLSGPCSETSFDGGQTKIDEWEPTEEQIESLRKASPIHYCGDDERSVLGQAALRYTIREALIAGHRIAREDQWSQSGSQLESSGTPSSDSLSPKSSTEQPTTKDATSSTDTPSHSLGRSSSQPSHGSQQTTPAKPSVAGSLDERAEALFAANPGWRPRSNDQSLSLQFHEGHWTWLSVNWFSVEPATANAHLLAALLPRAIEEWAWFRCTEAAPEFVYRSKTVVPRDIESAIRVLEGA